MSALRDVDISRARLALIAATLAAIVAGSLVDITTRREDWPLSSYPMYSSVEADRTTTKLQLVGVPRDPELEPQPVLETDELAPLDKTRIGSAFARLYGTPNGEARVRVAIADVLERYEQRREDEEHSGPELAAMRLYERTWELLGDASNRPDPDVERMLEEVRAR